MDVSLSLPVEVADSPKEKESVNKARLHCLNQALKLGFTQDQFQDALKKTGGDGTLAIAQLMESSVGSIGDAGVTSSDSTARRPTVVLTDARTLLSESEVTDDGHVEEPTEQNDKTQDATDQLSFTAGPGFQLQMICTCTTLTGSSR